MGPQTHQLCLRMALLRLLLPILLLALSSASDNHLYTKVYTPEEKKAMGKAIRFLADMDQSFNGRVRPRFGKRSPYEDAQRMLANMDQSFTGKVRPRFGKRSPYEDAQQMLANMDQSFTGQVRPRFGKRGSNDEALRFIADMDQSYNGQVRPRFGKRASSRAQYDPEVDWVPDTEREPPFKSVNRQIWKFVHTQIAEQSFIEKFCLISTYFLRTDFLKS